MNGINSTSFVPSICLNSDNLQRTKSYLFASSSPFRWRVHRKGKIIGLCTRIDRVQSERTREKRMSKLSNNNKIVKKFFFPLFVSLVETHYDFKYWFSVFQSIKRIITSFVVCHLTEREKQIK